MASVRELRQKTKSVKSTQQITKAMKMVSAARLNKAQTRILTARPYAKKMEHLLHEIAWLNSQAGLGYTHPFLTASASKRIDLVVVTADRGLCGAFNTTVVRHAVQYLRDHKEDDVRLWVVGKKGRDYFRRYRIPVEREYVNFFNQVSFQQAVVLSKDVTDAFLENKPRAVVLLYNEFKSRLQGQLVERTLLPVLSLPETHPTVDFLYEPSRSVVLDGLLRDYITNQFFRMLLESQSAELAARMTAMDNATENAKELIQSLTLTMNKLRQASITKEILEIVSGAEALQAG